nr:MAG TPA: hypothetical protein [Caudoviricetes sp.]
MMSGLCPPPNPPPFSSKPRLRRGGFTDYEALPKRRGFTDYVRLCVACEAMRGSV